MYIYVYMKKNVRFGTQYKYNVYFGCAAYIGIRHFRIIVHPQGFYKRISIPHLVYGTPARLLWAEITIRINFISKRGFSRPHMARIDTSLSDLGPGAGDAFAYWPIAIARRMALRVCRIPYTDPGTRDTRLMLLYSTLGYMLCHCSISIRHLHQAFIKSVSIVNRHIAHYLTSQETKLAIRVWSDIESIVIWLTNRTDFQTFLPFAFDCFLLFAYGDF